MTKEAYNYFSQRDSKYLITAKLLFGLFIVIFVSLIVVMFIYQIHSYFVNFVLILIVMYLFYKFVFYDYIYYIRKFNDLKRIKLMKKFELDEEVIEYFDNDVFKHLYDDEFTIIHKNEVYVLALTEIEDSIHSLGIAVYLMENSSQEINPSSRELSNELTGYIADSSIVKVIILVKDKFDEEELDSIEFDAAIHRNTTVIGIEKSTNTLIYNYFLNGEKLDSLMSELFKVNLLREEY